MLSLPSAVVKPTSRVEPTKQGLAPLFLMLIPQNEVSFGPAPIYEGSPALTLIRRFATWQGGTPGIVNGFASLDAGMSAHGTGFSAEVRTDPWSGLDGPCCASVGTPVRSTPHASTPSPAAVAASVAAPAIRAQSGHPAHQGRRSSLSEAASSRVPTPSFERISETWYFAPSRLMPRR